VFARQQLIAKQSFTM